MLDDRLTDNARAIGADLKSVIIKLFAPANWKLDADISPAASGSVSGHGEMREQLQPIARGGPGNQRLFTDSPLS